MKVPRFRHHFKDHKSCVVGDLFWLTMNEQIRVSQKWIISQNVWVGIVQKIITQILFNHHLVNHHFIQIPNEKLAPFYIYTVYILN